MSSDKLDLDLSLINKFLRNDYTEKDYPMMRKIIAAFQNGELVDVDIPIDVELIGLALMDPNRDLMADLEKIGFNLGDVMSNPKTMDILQGNNNNQNDNGIDKDTATDTDTDTSEDEYESGSESGQPDRPEPWDESQANNSGDLGEAKRPQKWVEPEAEDLDDLVKELLDPETKTNESGEPERQQPWEESQFSELADEMMKEKDDEGDSKEESNSNTPEPKGEAVVTTTNDGGLGVALGMLGGLLENVDMDVVSQVMSGEMNIEDSGVDASMLSGFGIDLKTVSQFVNNGLMQDPEAERPQQWVEPEANEEELTETDKNDPDPESETESLSSSSSSIEVTPTPEAEPESQQEQQQPEKDGLIDTLEMEDDKSLMNESTSIFNLCVIL